MRSLIVSFVVAVTGCNGSHNPGDEEPQGELSLLTFENVSNQVIEPYCLRCHSAAGGNKGGVNLENYSNVKRLEIEIADMVGSGAMPPTGDLPARQRQLLMDWLQAGAPETQPPTTEL